MYTAWGYEVDYLPPILTFDDFDALTGGKHGIDLRVKAALDAASGAIRDACGWHVSPALDCKAVLTADGRLAKLPANLVTAVESVTDGGTLLAEGEYEWSRKGLVRRACFKQFSQAWDAVEVAYTAGYEADAVPTLVDAVKRIVEGVLTMPLGVSSESADGVTISYSASAQSVANAMTSQMMAQLAPFRLVSAHAA